jgi:hypothetical protein
MRNYALYTIYYITIYYITIYYTLYVYVDNIFCFALDINQIRFFLGGGLTSAFFLEGLTIAFFWIGGGGLTSTFFG